MSNVGDVKSSADLFNSLNQARDTKSKSQETQDRFLKLLITQLQNQDPMNPVDNAQSTSQMAQMSTVTGIENLNASITSMMTTFNAGQSYQAAALIGKQVLVEGDTLQFDGKTALTGEIDVPEGGARVTVGIYNATNQKVDEIDLGDLKAGRQAVTWDGVGSDGKALAAGTYYMSANTEVATGAGKVLPTYTYVNVKSVALEAGNVNLSLADGRVVPYSKVNSIM